MRDWSGECMFDGAESSFLRMSSEIVSQAEMLSQGDSLQSPWPSSPTVSLIVVSAGPCSELRRALSQLCVRRVPCSEVLVVRPGPLSADMKELLASAGARYIEAAAGQSLPELRQLGASQASGQVVVIREDRALIDAASFKRLGRPANLERQVPVRVDVDRPAASRAASARGPRAARIIPGGAHA